LIDVVKSSQASDEKVKRCVLGKPSKWSGFLVKRNPSDH
jgi:hypothetical protein